MKKFLFPTKNVSLSDAIEIVKYGLYDDTIPMQSKVLAIERLQKWKRIIALQKLIF